MNQRTRIKWSTFRAIEYAEGFGQGENATDEARVEAYAYLKENNLTPKLQGFFGRTLNGFISTGIITDDGIDWDMFDELNDGITHIIEE